jgi:hypothetical protein
MRKLLVLAALLSTVSPSLLAGTPKLGVGPAPAADLSEDVWTLVQSLLARRVPVRVVVPIRLWSPTYRAGRSDTPPPSIADLLAKFNKRHPSMHVFQRDGVVRVQQRVLPSSIEAVLARRHNLTQPVTATGVNLIFYTVGEIVWGKQTKGLVGGGLEPGSGCTATQWVQVRSGSATVSDIGDEVVRQLHGTGWLLTFDETMPETSIALGLVCADGWWARYAPDAPDILR